MSNESKLIKAKLKWWVFGAFFGLSLLTHRSLLITPISAADTNDMVQEGLKLYEKGEYDRALKQFIKVLRFEPNNGVARDYMLRCSQKIVETRAGPRAAERAEERISLDKKIQEMAPLLAPAPPAEPPDSGAAADLPPVDFQAPAALPAVPTGAPAAVAPSMPDLPAVPAPDIPENAKSLLQERGTMTDELRRRYLGRGNIVQLEEDGGKLDVVLYMNRLFMPFSDVLRQDAYAVLDHVVSRVRHSPTKKVNLKAVDNVSPAVRHNMPDLAARRCTIVFSYLIHSSLPADARAPSSTSWK
jgi:hypothetical protein